MQPDVPQIGSSVRQRLHSIVVAHLGIDAAKVTDGSNLLNLGADSLDLIEMVMLIEEEFSVDMDGWAMEDAWTFKDLVDAVEREAA